MTCVVAILANSYAAELAFPFSHNKFANVVMRAF
jgi:hypothetical protein